MEGESTVSGGRGGLFSVDHTAAPSIEHQQISHGQGREKRKGRRALPLETKQLEMEAPIGRREELEGAIKQIFAGKRDLPVERCESRGRAVLLPLAEARPLLHAREGDRAPLRAVVVVASRDDVEHHLLSGMGCGICRLRVDI